jgi:hypothetical protein
MADSQSLIGETISHFRIAIASDQAFQKFLTRTQHVPDAQSLQGMICSCHARWSRELASLAPWFVS